MTVSIANYIDYEINSLTTSHVANQIWYWAYVNGSPEMMALITSYGGIIVYDYFTKQVKNMIGTFSFKQVRKLITERMENKLTI